MRKSKDVGTWAIQDHSERHFQRANPPDLDKLACYGCIIVIFHILECFAFGRWCSPVLANRSAKQQRSSRLCENQANSSSFPGLWWSAVWSGSCWLNLFPYIFRSLTVCRFTWREALQTEHFSVSPLSSAWLELAGSQRQSSFLQTLESWNKCFASPVEWTKLEVRTCISK